MIKWFSRWPRRIGKTNILLAELKERQYLRQLQPTLFVPRNFYATDMRIPLELKHIEDYPLDDTMIERFGALLQRLAIYKIPMNPTHLLVDMAHWEKIVQRCCAIGFLK
jgi:hypothetical protein